MTNVSDKLSLKIGDFSCTRCVRQTVEVYRKVVFPLLYAALSFVAGGCVLVGDGYEAAGGAISRSVGFTSWAYQTDIGKGKIKSVEERTRKNGKLLGKFRDCAE